MSIAELCTNFIKSEKDSSKILDKNILEFCTAEWGLGLGSSKEIPPLYPAQRFIIKCFYQLELDKSSNRDIIIKDRFNEIELYRFNEVEYLNYLFNEGRVNRRDYGNTFTDLILVCGRRAGKCVSEGTFVNTNNGLIEIQELGNRDGEEYQPLKVGVAQEGINRSESAYFYNGGERDIVKLKSFYGFHIDGTPNHRVKILDNDGTIKWRHLEDIKVGDILCIHRKTDMWSKDYVTVEKYKGKLTGRKCVNTPNIFDEKWSELLGILVGDGTWVSNNSLDVTVGPYPDWLNQVINIFTNTIGKPSVLKKNGKEVYKVSYCSVDMRAFFDKIGFNLDSKSDTKRIPWIIMQSPKSVVASFLRGLFETDGCVESKRSIVSFSTASLKLAQELQLLLLNFGIVSRVKNRLNRKFNKVYYHLNIVGFKSLKIFHNEIGFISERKKSLLENHINKGFRGNKSKTESIPYQKEWCRKLRDSVCKGKSDGIYPKKKSEPKRMLLRDAIGNVLKTNCTENFNYFRLDKAILVAKNLNADIKVIKHFEDIQNTEYFFDTVTEVTQGRERVYDLNVPDGESFVANGMTNHNTTITACIIAYETYRLLNKYCPQEYYGIMPEDDIRITCVSTGKDTAAELFNKVTGHLERSEFFRKYRDKPTKQRMKLRSQRDLDKYGDHGRATVSIDVAPCSAKGLRGRNNLIVALDEMAFFFYDEYKKIGSKPTGSDKNDKAIYDAVTPSIAKFKKPDGIPDGKVICISSPCGRNGKFYEEYERSYKQETTNLFMIQAPTWEIDPNLSTEYLKSKFSENPRTFISEFGAQFSDKHSAWIEDETTVRQNIVPSLRYKVRSFERVPHFMGIDVGLKNDGTSVCIGHWVKEKVEGQDIDKIEVDCCDIRFAGDEGKDYFVPDEISDWVASYLDRFYVVKGLMDQYYGLSVVPLLEKKGHKCFESRTFTEVSNSTAYQNLLSTFISQTIRLPDGNPVEINGKIEKDTPLVQELLTLQAYQKSKYLIKVAAPETEGSHDDLSDALARMVLVATEYKIKGIGVHSVGVISSQARMYKNVRSLEARKIELKRPSMRTLAGGNYRRPSLMPSFRTFFR